MTTKPETTTTQTPAPTLAIPQAYRDAMTWFISTFPQAATRAGQQRLEAALQIAATEGSCQHNPETNTWSVQSASRPVTYTVAVGSCTCPDHAKRGHQSPCKHRIAVQIFKQAITTQAEGWLKCVRSRQIEAAKFWRQATAQADRLEHLDPTHANYANVSAEYIRTIRRDSSIALEADELARQAAAQYWALKNQITW